MVDGVKSSTVIEENKYRFITSINGQKKIVQDFNKGSFCRVMITVCGLVSGKHAKSVKVRLQLSSYNSLQDLPKER